MYWTTDDFDNALKLGTTFLAYGLRVQLLDGTIYAWTNIRRQITIGQLEIPIRPGKTYILPSTTYDPRAALRVTNLEKTDAPGTTDNMEARLTLGDALPENLVRAGVFDNRPYWMTTFDWRTPVGVDGKPRALLQMRGSLGDHTIQGHEVMFKLRSMGFQLKSDVLEVTSRDSRARWGDPELAGFNLNGNTADGYPARISANIAEIDPSWPRRRFRLASAANYPDDRFIDGTASFTGMNAHFVAGLINFEPLTGWFVTTKDTPSPLQVGDSVMVQIRPPRTLTEWITYIGNARLFAGEPGIPTYEAANRVR